MLNKIKKSKEKDRQVVTDTKYDKMIVDGILHIGNILNNGYLQCKYLRRNGIDADSLNVDYQHVQGQPEWAEVDILEPVDEFNPDWSKVDLKGYKRPAWFFDVTLSEIEKVAKDLRNRKYSEIQSLINQRRNSLPKKIKEFVKTVIKNNKVIKNTGLCTKLRKIRSGVLRGQGGANADNLKQSTIQHAELIEEYRTVFADRRPCLSKADIDEWIERSLAHRAIFKHYRLIQAYSLDPIYVLLGNRNQPFICYEHGTMREFPFEDSARGRLYSLCLKKAEKVIITNADCNKSAERLGLDNYIYIPHIIDDELFKPSETTLRKKLMEEHHCDYVLVAPSRHHWKNCPDGLENSWFKRNDILIKGLGKLFKKKPDLKALVVFFEWGQEVDLSKALIRDCGFEDKVRWEPIRSKPALKEFFNAADVILDQFNDGIGTFGAVVPEAMACAKPVILNYKAELHTWCYPKLPPAINASSEDEISKILSNLLENKSYRMKIGESGFDWFVKYHSSRIVIDKLTDVYKTISDKYGWGWEL